MRPEDEPICYTSIKNPEWVDDKRQAVVCTVKFEHSPIEEDFVAKQSDPMPYGQEIFARCVGGEFGVLSVARKERTDRLLKIPGVSGSGESFVVGDLYSPATDKELQVYIERHNRENRSGSETGTVIALGSILDHVLKKLLIQQGIKTDGSFQRRIELAHQQSIINDSEYRSLTLVRTIRNAFGHEPNISLCNEPQRSQCISLYEAVIGDGATPSLRLRFSAACVEIMGNLLPRLSL